MKPVIKTSVIVILLPGIATNWESPNTGATNITGFTALPGGMIDAAGGFGSYNGGMGTAGLWWSSAPPSDNTYPTIILYSDTGAFSFIEFALDGTPGLSVRCLMD